MKRILIIAFAVLIFSPLHAGIKIAYNDFNVGNASANIRFYTDSIFGARGDGLREGGTVSTLDFNQSFTSYNPACLAYQKTAIASFSGIPFEIISSPVAGFILIGHDFSKDFKDALEKSIGNMVSGTATVANSDFYLAQANGLSGMEGILPFADNNASIGVAREEKLGLEMNILGEGLTTNMAISDPSNPDPAFAEGMTLSVVAGLAADINLKSIVTSIGIGRKINPQFGVGAVVEYIDTRLSANGNAGADAKGDILGTTFEYNTNTQNSLSQNLSGELSAAAWALRVGASYHAPNDLAEVAIDFSIQPRFTFGGELTGLIHTLPSKSADIIQNFFSSRTTSTIAQTVTTKDMDIKMKLPSYFRATLAYKPGAVLAFNYTYNFDAFSLSMENKDFALTYSALLQHSFRLGLNFEYFQIGGGIILEQESVRMENKNDSTGRSYTADNIIPVASIGWVIPMGKNLKTEWELAAFPFPECKAALTLYY